MRRPLTSTNHLSSTVHRAFDARQYVLNKFKYESKNSFSRGLINATERTGSNFYYLNGEKTVSFLHFWSLLTTQVLFAILTWSLVLFWTMQSFTFLPLTSSIFFLFKDHSSLSRRWSLVSRVHHVGKHLGRMEYL